jgi:adenine-specific DNA-methyltransferase
MAKVFIGGSRTIIKLNDAVRARLDEIVAKGHAILIGDAIGAERAIQTYLNTKGYRKVEVHYCEERPKYNLGGWKSRRVRADPPAGREEHEAARDRAMAAEADYGLILWNGESIETLLNIRRLAAGGKHVQVYLSPIRKFIEIADMEDWKRLVQYLSGLQAERFVQVLQKESAAPPLMSSARQIPSRGQSV